MAELKVIEKPESVSYDVIRGVLQEAHRENIARGIVSRTVTYSADDLAGRALSRDEKTFVAMDGDKVVGTVSCRKAQSIHCMIQVRKAQRRHIEALKKNKFFRFQNGSF